MADEAITQSAPPDTSLDDPSLYNRIDPTGLRDRLRTFPLQCRQAWERAQGFGLPGEYSRVDRVVVAGMGGSVIGGDLVADLASLEDSPPITVCRDYVLPKRVDEHTLLLACSYSGETEETLSTFRQALSQGAKVIAVTRGGALASEAREHSLPLFRVEYDGEPRSALGYGFMVPLVLLTKLGLISDKATQFQEAMSVLDRKLPELVESCQSRENLAKTVAQQLLGRVPVIYGAGIFSGVARRWKTQINENAKTWAFFELLPEVHHNSVAGYSFPESTQGRVSVILLKPTLSHPRIRLRYQITESLLETGSIPHITIEGHGEGALSQMLSTILMGDYVSYYLALLQGLDPSPVPAIDYVKERIPGAGGEDRIDRSA